MVVQTDLDYGHLRSNSLSILGDTMLVAYQSQQHGQPGTGMGVYDISNPEDPKRIAFYDAQGPGSRGCHCLWWVDGDYAHLATGTPDSRPTDPKDDQFYVIMDVSNPANPQEAGRWWLPGTQEGDDAPPPDRHPYLDVGHSVHNTNVYPNRSDRAYCGWKDSGVITLDISDVSRPSMVAQLNYAPPFPGFTHTVLPLFSRDLLVVTQEATALGGADYPKLVWLMDNRLETNPVIISTLPMQDTDDFFNRPGRYGAHNIHENRPGPLSLRSDTLVYATFFNAGIRVFDTTNPFQPRGGRLLHPPNSRGRRRQRHQRRPRGRKRHHVRGGPAAGRAVYPGDEYLGPPLRGELPVIFSAAGRRQHPQHMTLHTEPAIPVHRCWAGCLAVKVAWLALFPFVGVQPAEAAEADPAGVAELHALFLQ